jgi:hypothetical protein
MSNGRKLPQAGRHRGRRREASRSIVELAAPGVTGVKLLAVGALGSAAVMAALSAGAASAATSPIAATLTADTQQTPAATPNTTSAPTAQPAAPAPSANSAFSAVQAMAGGQTRPVINVVIVGDSYTSGEGNNNNTYATDANGNILPQHQSNMSPAMQALQGIIDANPGVDFQVSNVAVSGATRIIPNGESGSAYTPSYSGTPYEQQAQLSAVANADIVINGFGGNDAQFPTWARTLLSPSTSDSSVPALWNGNPADPTAPNYSQFFTSGANLDGQVTVLNDIASLAKPGAVVITNGYPQVFGDTAPSWSPFSPYTTTLGQNAATFSNTFAQSLASDNQSATAIAEAQNNPVTGTTFYFGNLQGALNGGQIGSSNPMVNYITPGLGDNAAWFQQSFHPNALGQTAMGAALQPVVNQAFADWATANGVQLNTDVQPTMNTFAYQWNNRVDVPLQVQGLQQFQQDQMANDLASLAQQAQQGPQFNADGSPANLWTALTTQAGPAPAGWTAQPTLPWPQTDSTGQPSAPGSGQPSAPGSGQPSAPGSDQPSAPGSDQPSAPGGVQTPPRGTTGGDPGAVGTTRSLTLNTDSSGSGVQTDTGGVQTDTSGGSAPGSQMVAQTDPSQTQSQGTSTTPTNQQQGAGQSTYQVTTNTSYTPSVSTG